MKKKIILIGSGGHAKSCINLLNNNKKYKLDFIADKKSELNKKILSYKVTKSLSSIIKYKNKNILIGIGQIKSPNLRIKIFNNLKKKNFIFPIIISNSSIVSKFSNIEEGTSIFHQVYIGPNVKIGKNCIINNHALIEHDVTIGNNCHVSTGVKINGNVIIGNNTFIGSGTILHNNLIIGEDCVIGAGKVIKKNIKQKKIIK